MHKKYDLDAVCAALVGIANHAKELLITARRAADMLAFSKFWYYVALACRIGRSGCANISSSVAD
jgi:hypothetical protein